MLLAEAVRDESVKRAEHHIAYGVERGDFDALVDMCANFKLRHERYGCFKWSVVCNDFSVSDRRPGGSMSKESDQTCGSTQ
jgi:hypothetical protein